MSLKSWAKRATTIPKSGKGILGNLIKNASPFLALTGVGALGSAGASVAGDLIRGKRDLKSIALGAATNASLGKGVRGLAKRFGPGAPAAVAPPAAVPAPGVPSPAAGIPSSIAPTNATAALQGAPAGGGGFTAALNTPVTPTASPSFLSRLGGSIDKYPNAAAMGLNAASNVLTSGSENAMNDAQTDLLEQRYAETEDDRRRRAATDAFFKGGSLSLAPMPVRPSPYGG